MKKIIVGSILTATIALAQYNPRLDTILTPIKAKLINGSVFTYDIRETGNDLLIVDNNDCKYLGKGYFSLSTERTYVKLNQKSCLINGNIETSDIDGFVIEEHMTGIYTKPVIVANTNNFISTLQANKDIEIVITKSFDVPKNLNELPKETQQKVLGNMLYNKLNVNQENNDFSKQLNKRK